MSDLNEVDRVLPLQKVNFLRQARLQCPEICLDRTVMCHDHLISMAQWEKVLRRLIVWVEGSDEIPCCVAGLI